MIIALTSFCLYRYFGQYTVPLGLLRSDQASTRPRHPQLPRAQSNVWNGEAKVRH
jgi:hypothetical protein